MRLIIGSLAALLLLGACSSGPESSSTSSSGDGEAASSHSISGLDNRFEPAELKLTPGEEVTLTFTNNGETIHTFTSDELGFDTGNVDPGAAADVTFTAPEEATRFVCKIHEGSDDMVGTISPSDN